MPVEAEINVAPYTVSTEGWSAHAKVWSDGPGGFRIILEEHKSVDSPEQGQLWAEAKLEELATELRARAVRDAQKIQIRKTL
jgi:hypothetical protein